MSILRNLKPKALLTLTALTLVALAPLVVSAAPKIVAHGAGNGGDHLELTPDDGQGDVEISVPDDLGREGILEVVGEPGAGQYNVAFYSFCESDAQGKLIRGGCEDESKAFYVNNPIALVPGIYRLRYSSTLSFVRVQAEQKTVALLKKLKVSKTDRAVSFSVFRDLTDSSMQDQLLKYEWSTAASQTIIVDRLCQPASLPDKNACDSLVTDDFHALRDRFIQFNQDGTYSYWTFAPNPNVTTAHLFENGGRIYVTDPEAGQFVSVFPGVYGVVFTDNQTGKSETRYGIRVQ